MDWRVWLGFVAASAAMGIVPSPGVMSIVAYAMVSGRRVALAAVAGLALGNAVAMTLSLLGVGALLARSTLAFSIVKWVGALYLVALGIRTIATSGRAAAAERTAAEGAGARAAFAGNVLVGTFHPKTIVFFVAFVPQFIDANGHYATQAALLVATFCAVVAATDTTYALAASRASALIRRPGLAVWSKRAGGGVLIASGVATAATRA